MKLDTTEIPEGRLWSKRRACSNAIDLTINSRKNHAIDKTSSYTGPTR